MFFSIISKLFFRSASSTRSAFSASIPDEIKRPPGLIKFAMQSESGMITSARISQLQCQQVLLIRFGHFRYLKYIKVFSLDACFFYIIKCSIFNRCSTAYGSMSRQNADFAPQSSEHIARIPLPQPASRSVVSVVIYFLSDKRQSFVVS